MFLHLLRFAGGIFTTKKRIREKRRGYLSFFSSFLFFRAISRLQKPLMPVQHPHQGSALKSILATDLFLSLLSLSLSTPVYPFLFLFLALFYGDCTIT